ncbi:VOC family protein [Microbulbifer yueqingensis]|nr:VOC family protein [Microbulbifer yueqingensis]
MNNGNSKAIALGINHVALEVRDLEEELDFLGRLFRFSLRGREENMAFIELGDQFIALLESSNTGEDSHRHFGLVVDDREAVEARLRENGIPIVGDRFLDFRDPSGNRWQVVEYGEVQFIKHEQVLARLGAGGLRKSAASLEQLREKGIAP